MRKFVVALAAGAIGVGVVVSPAAALPTGGPGEPTCQADVISHSVREGPGRRAVAEFFFGVDPNALEPQVVQEAERTVRGFCAG
jgi:hypothetical protein